DIDDTHIRTIGFLTLNIRNRLPAINCPSWAASLLTTTLVTSGFSTNFLITLTCALMRGSSIISNLIRSGIIGKVCHDHFSHSGLYDLGAAIVNRWPIHQVIRILLLQTM